MPTTRRTFCTTAASLLLTPPLLRAQQQPRIYASSRPDVAAIDRDRTLRAADAYLTEKPVALTALLSPRNPGSKNDYFSEADDYFPNPEADPANPNAPYLPKLGPPNPEAFTAHRDALLNLCLYVPAFTAASLLTRESAPAQSARYAAQAAAHLRAWFIDPVTAMTPSIQFAKVIRPAKTGRPEGLVEAVHLAEVAMCLPFLANTEALTEPEHNTLHKWFFDYAEWLKTSRLAGLARDTRSHHGSSWLLQVTAIAHLQLSLAKPDDRALAALRHQFKTVTIRAQIIADGSFPREVSTPYPYRNSLFNLDMLTAVCELLTTRFESLWEYELQDGPGMRVVLAHHVPYLLNRGAWPYRADYSHFGDLPLRRPALLFAARAYTRPEYAALWQTLPPNTTIPELQRTFPIRQPLLWITRPKP